MDITVRVCDNVQCPVCSERIADAVDAAVENGLEANFPAAKPWEVHG